MTEPVASPRHEPSDDLELMRRVAAEQPEAQKTLVMRVVGLVRARARALTRSDADADDATQNSMIEILNSAKSFSGTGTLLGWCERITIRTTLREQRRRARHLALIDDRVDPDDLGVGGRLRAGASQPADILDVLDVLDAFDAALSVDRRRALALRAEGYSIEEIAAQTEVSPNTVKDRIRMARRELRQTMRQREVVASVRRITI